MKTGMKRSEMVKLMVEYWLGLFPNEQYQDPEIQQEVEERMGKLLDWQVHKGMLPPALHDFNPKFDALYDKYGFRCFFEWKKEE